MQYGGIKSYVFFFFIIKKLKNKFFNIRKIYQISDNKIKLETSEKLKKEDIGFDVKLLKGSKEWINATASFITDFKNLKIKPIDSTIKNREIICGDELPFGIINLFIY